VVVRHRDPPASTELNHAHSGGVGQLCERRTQCDGAGQRLLDPHDLTDARQEALDRLELRGELALSVHRFGNVPQEARKARAVQANVDAIPGVSMDPECVVRSEGLPLRLRAEIWDVEQPAVEGMPHSGNPFIQRVVGPKVEPFQIRPPFPAETGPHKVDPTVIPGIPRPTLEMGWMPPNCRQRDLLAANRASPRMHRILQHGPQ